MRYEDTIILSKQGASRCIFIPAKWLKLHNLERYNFAVDIVVDDEQIVIRPNKSRYLTKQLSKDPSMGSPVALKESESEGVQIEEPAP